MTTLQLSRLETDVRTLATLEDTGDPVVSCYLDLSIGRLGALQVLAARHSQLRGTVEPDQRDRIDDAFRRIRQHLTHRIPKGARGVATFARAGRAPFFLSLGFARQVRTFVTVDSLPSIYQLVEMKDAWERYVVLLMTRQSARIFEVHLGAATRQLWLERPETRDRVGREWARLRYQDHRTAGGRQFINETLTALRRLTEEEGYPYIVIGGDSRRVNELLDAMPNVLASRVLEASRLSPKTDEDGIVEATIGAFIEQEQRDSDAAVDQLFHALHRHGMAVTGAHKCAVALRSGQADQLIIHQTAELEPLWFCDTCAAVWTSGDEFARCPTCEGDDPRVIRNTREELVRLAEASGVPVETVGDNDRLATAGGVGCLLRFALPG